MTFSGVNPLGYTGITGATFPPNTQYTVTVVPPGNAGGTPYCSITFTTSFTNNTGTGCNVSFLNTPDTSTTQNDILVKVTGLSDPKDSTKQLRVTLYHADSSGNRTGNAVAESCPTIASLYNSPVNFGKHEVYDNYTAIVWSWCGLIDNPMCSQWPFAIKAPGDTGGGVNKNPPTSGGGGKINCIFGCNTPPAPPPPCASGALVNGNCLKVPIALGITISTDAAGFINNVFRIILSVSGGIAILLIIISGYKILSSQGNPETIKGAREQLTAAIVGLVFIILALVVLQVIGVDILRIPGFR